jgi:hypothetical protein
MKLFFAPALCSLLLLTLQGCAGLNSQQTSNSNPIAPPIQNSAMPVMVKVISSTPISKPIIADNHATQSKENGTNSTEVQAEPPSQSLGNANEYQVVFQYKDQTFATVLPFDPGETLMIQGDAPSNPAMGINSNSTAPGTSTNINNIYVLPPVGMPYYPYPTFGFFTAFPVYLSKGYYHRIPSASYFNPGAHFHHNGSRGRGRK